MKCRRRKGLKEFAEYETCECTAAWKDFSKATRGDQTRMMMITKWRGRVAEYEEERMISMMMICLSFKMRIIMKILPT